MGVLAGIEDATSFDLRRCEAFVGTSAGAIVAAHLASGQRPRRPARAKTEIEVAVPKPVDGLAAAGLAAARRAGAVALGASAAFAPLALGAAAPGGAVLRATMLRRVPRPSSTLDSLRAHVERSGARFDGRLRVTAVDRRTGRRVVFGSPRAPRASAAAAVTASCTVPWLFAPVEINGREYVDGGVWSPDQPRRRAGRPRYPRPVPAPDGQHRREPSPALRDPARRPLGGVIGGAGGAPPRRPRAMGRPRPGRRRRDGLRLHGSFAARPRAGRRIPPGAHRGPPRWVGARVTTRRNFLADTGL